MVVCVTSRGKRDSEFLGVWRLGAGAWVFLVIVGIGCACSNPSPGEPDLRRQDLREPAGAGSESVEPDWTALVEGILELWQGADLICLGETHGSLLDSALRHELVRHPRFAEVVDVIVVEFANPRFQDRLDRWILDGERLPFDQLRSIWLDAGLGEMWDLEIYRSFLAAVADLNAALPESERIPVIGAAQPIDWPSVKRAEDLRDFQDRIGHFEGVLRREVLDPDLKALAIFGVGHCERRTPSLLSRLVAWDPERVSAVFAFEGERGRAAGHRALGLDHPKPQLIKVSGTELEKLPAGDMFFEGHGIAGVEIGELVDAIVDYGIQEDTVLAPYIQEPEIREQLDRRAGWMSAAGS